jgi:N-acetylneuraminic acid mutarotase
MLYKQILFVLLNLLFAFVQAQDRWTSQSRLPVERERATAFVIGNYGYVGTGVGGDRLRNDFYRYNPETDTWTEIDTMPTLGRRGAFSFAINGKGYVGGGVNENSLLDDEFWEYDPDQLLWSKRASLPHGLVYADETLVGFSIGKVGYLLDCLMSSNFYQYDPTTNTWSSRANFPGSKGLGQVGFTIGGKGYVGSGFGMDFVTEFWEYDPVMDQWSKKANIPGPGRIDPMGFSIGNYGYIGLGINRGTFEHDFWEYHPVTDSWKQIADCPFDVWYAVGFGIGAKGYIGTGVRFSHDSGWWEYSPTSSGVKDIELSDKVNIYPNPVGDILNFESNRFDLKTYSIISVMGKVTKSGTLIGNTISVADLPGGVYFLNFPMKSGVLRKKFMKN